jgi:hypothetical protein
MSTLHMRRQPLVSRSASATSIVTMFAQPTQTGTGRPEAAKPGSVTSPGEPPREAFVAVKAQHANPPGAVTPAGWLTQKTHQNPIPAALMTATGQLAISRSQ